MDKKERRNKRKRQEELRFSGVFSVPLENILVTSTQPNKTEIPKPKKNKTKLQLHKKKKRKKEEVDVSTEKNCILAEAEPTARILQTTKAICLKIYAIYM